MFALVIRSPIDGALRALTVNEERFIQDHIRQVPFPLRTHGDLKAIAPLGITANKHPDMFSCEQGTLLSITIWPSRHAACDAIVTAAVHLILVPLIIGGCSTSAGGSGAVTGYWNACRMQAPGGNCPTARGSPQVSRNLDAPTCAPFCASEMAITHDHPVVVPAIDAACPASFGVDFIIPFSIGC